MTEKKSINIKEKRRGFHLFCSVETSGILVALMMDENVLYLSWENGITQQTNLQHVGA